VPLRHMGQERLEQRMPFEESVLDNEPRGELMDVLTTVTGQAGLPTYVRNGFEKHQIEVVEYVR
jgi:hypothetical protein